MWRTSLGVRALRGAEAELFRAAVLEIVELVKEGDDSADWFHIEPFCSLTWSQKLHVLQEVSECLLRVDARPLPLTAVNESAVATVFEHVSVQTDRQPEQSPEGASWRNLIRQACDECFGDTLRAEDDSDSLECFVLPADSADSQTPLWNSAVEMLADRVLWDRDYSLIDEFIDEPPEKASMLRRIMGIDDNYFSAAAGDLNSVREVQTCLTKLKHLLD